MKDWTQVERYLRRIAETDGITEDHLWEIRERHGAESSGTAKLTDESIETWDRFRKGGHLSDDDKSRLEAIVLPNGLRPAFDIKDDSFIDLPDPWQALNGHRNFLDSCIRGIGRVDVPGHARLEYAGTGFIVADQVLLTNRHVADEFCETGGEVRFTPGISPSLDLKQEVSKSVSVTLNLRAPLLVLSDWDAALFRTDVLPGDVTPLKLAGTPPANADGRMVTIVGHPALDTRGRTEEILQQIQIFGAIFGKKRLQPGRLMGLRQTLSFGQRVNALAHDCSTLGGNSGSALIDIEEEKVVGLHFRGDYLVANYAVPTWELAQYQQLRDQGVQFM